MSIFNYYNEVNKQNMNFSIELNDFKKLDLWIKFLKSKLKNDKILKISATFNIEYVENKEQNRGLN